MPNHSLVTSCGLLGWTGENRRVEVCRRRHCAHGAPRLVESRRFGPGTIGFKGWAEGLGCGAASAQVTCMRSHCTTPKPQPSCGHGYTPQPLHLNSSLAKYAAWEALAQRAVLAPCRALALLAAVHRHTALAHGAPRGPSGRRRTCRCGVAISYHASLLAPHPSHPNPSRCPCHTPAVRLTLKSRSQAARSPVSITRLQTRRFPNSLVTQQTV